MANARFRIDPRFKLGEAVEILSAIHREVSGKVGVIVQIRESRHSHTLDKYVVQLENARQETLWDIELKAKAS